MGQLALQAYPILAMQPCLKRVGYNATTSVNLQPQEGITTCRGSDCCPALQDGAIMTSREAAKDIVAAIMQRKPPRELVTGGKARTALLGGFIQKWVYPEFVERKFMKMFGLQGLKAATT